VNVLIAENFEYSSLAMEEVPLWLLRKPGAASRFSRRAAESEDWLIEAGVVGSSSFALCNLACVPPESGPNAFRLIDVDSFAKDSPRVIDGEDKISNVHFTA